MPQCMPVAKIQPVTKERTQVTIELTPLMMSAIWLLKARNACK